MKLNLVAWCTDNGDGSNTVLLFNNKQELAKELAARDKTLEQVEAEDDPYENGYIVNVPLVCRFNDDASALELDKGGYISFG